MTVHPIRRVKRPSPAPEPEPASSIPAPLDAPRERWSPYQTAVFDNFRANTGNVVVRARAGSGKTTTIVRGLEYAPSGVRTMLCAFNKSIQEELRMRAPKDVEVKTLHAIGKQMVGRAFGQVTIDENKTGRLVKLLLSGHSPDDIPSNRTLEQAEKLFHRGVGSFAKLVSFAKNTLCPADVAKLTEIAVDRELDDAIPAPKLAEVAAKVLEMSAHLRTLIDFDDMIWLPWKHQLRQQGFDLVVVDETQDLNAAQLYLVGSLMRSTGRLVAVGDDRQAIYLFRGADVHAMSRIEEQFKASVLPLSITYRCPKRVVELARAYVPDFEAAPESIDGNISEITESKMLNIVRPGDFVIARINAPLMKLCIRLLAVGVPACVAGRDVAKTLLELIRQSNVSDSEPTQEFVIWIRDWYDEQIKLYAEENPKRVESANDKLELVMALVEGMKSIREVKSRIDKLFSDGDLKTRVVFTTVHKSKGLERDNVFLLRGTFRPSMSIEEANLYYVALTRTRQNLYFVDAG